MCAMCADGLQKYFGTETEDFKDFVLWNKTAFPFSCGPKTVEQLKKYRGAMLQGKDTCEVCAKVKSTKHLIEGYCRMCHKRASLSFPRGVRPTKRKVEKHFRQMRAGWVRS